MEPASINQSQPTSIPATIVVPNSEPSTSSGSDAFPADWLLWGAVLVVGAMVCYSRWSGARTARRLTAAADAYASRELNRLLDIPRFPKSAKRTESQPSGPHFLENVTCSS